MCSIVNIHFEVLCNNTVQYSYHDCHPQEYSQSQKVDDITQRKAASCGSEAGLVHWGNKYHLGEEQQINKTLYWLLPESALPEV